MKHRPLAICPLAVLLCCLLLTLALPPSGAQAGEPPTGSLALDPASDLLYFDTDPLPPAADVILQNNRSAVVQVTGAALRDGTYFTLSDIYIGDLAAGNNILACRVTANANLRDGTYRDEVQVTYENDFGPTTDTIPISITVGKAPAVTLHDIDFGSITQGDPAPAAQTVDWLNTSRFDVHINNLIYSGSDAFDLTPGHTGLVEPGTSKPLFTIAPRDDLAYSQTPYQGTVSIVYSDGRATHTVAAIVQIVVSHAGGTLSVIPLAFPSLAEGDTPMALPAMVTNSSTGPLVIAGVRFQSGANFAYNPTIPSAPLREGDTVNLGDITPNANLAAGPYADALIIDYTMGHLTDQAILPITLTVDSAASGSAITALNIPGQVGDTVISDTSITITMPYGTDVTRLTPDIVHTGIDISPPSGTEQDFSTPVAYTLTTAYGFTVDYTVTVLVAGASGSAITAVSIPGQVGDTVISDTSITITMPYGTDVTRLTPDIVHTGIDISPPSGTEQDFSAPVVYTVIMVDGSTVDYTVTVRIQDFAPGDGDKPAPVPISAPRPTYEMAVVVNVQAWANVRSGPGTDTDVIGQVLLGETIELTEWNKDETWCKVFFNGGANIGWLYYKFIKPIGK